MIIQFAKKGLSESITHAQGAGPKMAHFHFFLIHAHAFEIDRATKFRLLRNPLRESKDFYVSTSPSYPSGQGSIESQNVLP